uniref:Hemolysin-type calcium-binding region n=1 Tax=Pseudomonas syringae TaxID=317 RepID=I3W0J0_PSESX|nr:M10 family metallopeptidase C-terminal domain-containing protein [Pseudomonas syringae]AFK89117.1 Hemolysin-type calcium-binding region [Pseudomonas syringae]
MAQSKKTAQQSDADDTVVAIPHGFYDKYVGTADEDTIFGTTNADVIFGGDGDDILIGQGGDPDPFSNAQDRYNGGAGIDTITSHSAYVYGNTFVYTSVTDSYFDKQGSHSDLIKDFQSTDVLDLTALGLERVGNGHNGHNGDLAFTYNADEDITYVRSLDKNAQGQAFEVRLEGDHAAELGTQNFALRYDLTAESTGREHGLSNKQYVITGTDGYDFLVVPRSGNIVTGGGGADDMSGGGSRNTFVFEHLTDSFVNDGTGQSSVDLIHNFRLGDGDLLDVSALGFTGLGNGYNGTLNYSYDNEAGYAIAQSFEADEDGNRFAVHLTQYDRDPLTGMQDMDRFTFAGDSAADRANQTLTGDNHRDTFTNSTAGGILVGGGDDDLLVGNTGVDTFRYVEKSDSFRGNSDFIKNFDATQDRIDVSALGYTGLGDGTDGTLKVIYDTALNRTYLKDYEADADGNRFEISIDKNVAKTFTADNLIGADASAAHIELVGLAPADLHPIG